MNKIQIPGNFRCHVKISMLENQFFKSSRPEKKINFRFLKVSKIQDTRNKQGKTLGVSIKTLIQVKS